MKIPPFAKTGGAAMSASLLQQGFSMAHFMLVLHWLKPEALAAWAMYLTLISFVDMARLGLVQNALTHFSTHHPESVGAIRFITLLLSMSVALLGSLLLWLVVWELEGSWSLPGLRALFDWYPLIAVATAIVRWLDGLGISRQKFRTAMLSAGIYGLVFVGGTVFYFSGHPEAGVTDLAWLQIPAIVSSLVVAIWSEFGQLRGLDLRLHWLPRVWNYGRYGMMSNLGSMLMQRVDLLLLSALVSPASLALYNVATRVISYLDFPLNAVGLAATPKIAQTHSREGMKGVLRVYEQTIALLLAITIPLYIGTALLAPMLIHWIAGDAYSEATVLLQIGILAGFAKPWGRVFGITLDAIGLPELNFSLLIVSFLVSLVMNACLIPWWGIYGASIASVVTIWLTIAGGHYYLRWHLPVQPLAPFFAIGRRLRR